MIHSLQSLHEVLNALMPCADCPVVAQTEPATKQMEASSPKEIIVRPATSALPRILCTAAIPAATQQQPQTCVQAGTSSLRVAGSKYKAAAEPVQKLSRQHSTSTTHSADNSAPSMQVKREPSHDCLTGPAQQQVSASAQGIQSKQQASFNTVTSGEYHHLTSKRQLSVKAALPAPLTQQPEAPAVDNAPQATQLYGIFPAGEDGCIASDLNRGSSHSFESCYLPVVDMPDFDFEAGNSELPQDGFWGAGQDAHMPQTQMGVTIDSAPHDEAGSLAGHNKSWPWCSVMSQSLEQAPPCLPDLTPLPQLPPSWCATWDQQAWQASWQHQQPTPQDLHPHDQQQQFQHTPFVGVDLQPACPKGVANMDCTGSVGPSTGAEASWMMLPSCSMENMLQADPAFATGQLNMQLVILHFCMHKRMHKHCNTLTMSVIIYIFVHARTASMLLWRCTQ